MRRTIRTNTSTLPEEQRRGHESGRGWSWLLLAGGLSIPGLLILVTLPWPFQHGHGHHGSTRNNLKQLGLVFKMYANESEGEYWPRLAQNDGIWAPDMAQIFPQYLTDPGVIVAREHPDHDAIVACLNTVLAGPNPDFVTAAGLVALSFSYPGYAFVDQSGFEVLVQARRLGFLHGDSVNSMTLPGGGKVVPLWEDPGCRFAGPLPSDIDRPQPGSQSSRPVLIETWQWRMERDRKEFAGAHVLYMDGHVDFVPLGTFPVVPEVMDVLSRLAPAR